MINFQDYKVQKKNYSLFENSKMGIRFFHPKTFYFYQRVEMKQQSFTLIITPIDRATKKPLPFEISCFYIDQNQTVSDVVAMEKKRLNYQKGQNVTENLFKQKIGRWDFTVLEISYTTPQGLVIKHWSGILVQNATAYIFIHIEQEKAFDIRTLRDICQNLTIYPAVDYSVLHYINQKTGFTFQIPSIHFDIAQVKDTLFSSISPYNDVITCQTIQMNNLDEFVDFYKKKNKSTPMEHFNIEKILLSGGVHAYLLLFESPEAQNIRVALLVKDGLGYDITCISASVSPETFNYSLSTICFQKHSLKHDVLRITNFNQVEYTMDLPPNAMVQESYDDGFFASICDKFTTNVSIEERIDFKNAEIFRQQYIQRLQKNQKMKVGASVVKMVSTENYGKYCMIQILVTCDGKSGLFSIIPHKNKIIVLDSSCLTENYDKKMLEDMKRIHQSLRFKGGPDYESTYQSNLLNSNHFEDCVFIVGEETILMEYYQVGLQLSHTKSWKGKYFAQLPEFFIKYSKGDIEGDINVFGFINDVVLEEFVKMRTPPSDMSKNLTITETKISTLKAYILEYDLKLEDSNEYVHNWVLITFTNMRGYSFICEGDKDFTELKKLYFTAKFFLPLTSGRIQYCNPDLQFRLLLPGIDFDTHRPQEENCFLVAIPPFLDQSIEAHCKGYIHDDKDLKSLIERKKKTYQELYGDKFTEKENFKGYDLTNGHIFNRVDETNISSEFLFERNNKLLSIEYQSPKIYFPVDELNHDIFFYEIRTNNLPQKERIRYDCLNFNFSIDAPIYGKVLEFMESENIYSAVDIVDFEHEDGSFTIIRKEKLELNGTPYEVMEDVKTRMMASVCKIENFSYERRHSQYYAYELLISKFFDTMFNCYRWSLSTTVVINKKTVLVIDTGIDESRFKEEMIEKWRDIHKSFQLVIYLTPFDKDMDWCSPMSQPIHLPMDFSDTLIYFNK